MALKISSVSCFASTFPKSIPRLLGSKLHDAAVHFPANAAKRSSSSHIYTLACSSFKLSDHPTSKGLAAAGGVLRDGEGRWCGGFALNIGRCSAPLAELWGVYYGLYLAWGKQCTRVELEVDSELVVGFLQTGISATHPLSFLVHLCHGLIAKDWIVRVTHVYREANCLADGLANYAFSLPLGFHSLDVVPLEVIYLFEADELGSTRPRRIRV